MRLFAFHELKKFPVIALVLIFGCPTARGQGIRRSNHEAKADQLTILNQNQIEIPGDRARVLLIMTYCVVAGEFHRRPKDIELAMTLVLGERDEYYSIDKDGRMTLYLERWDEGKFVNGVITSVVQRLAPLHVRNQMFTEIRRRADRIAPVSAQQMRRPAGNPSPPGGESYPMCISEVATTPCSALNRPRRP